MNSRGVSTARLSVEQLESRELLSTGLTVETFDATAGNSLPTNWVQWTNTAGSTFQTQDSSGFGSPRSLVSNGTSTASSRAWFSTAYEKDIQVQADVFLNSASPLQIFARGQQLDTANPTYYALSVSRGLEVQLLKVVSGQSTVLGTVNSSGWVSGTWARVGLTVQGSRLQVQVFRTDTAQYLSPTGAWQSGPVLTMDRTDSSITAAGRVGVARTPMAGGAIALDNFVINTGTPAGLASTLLQQDFGSNLVRGIPAGWSSYSNISGQTMQVVATSRALTGSSAVGVTGASGLVARAWADAQQPADVQVSAALYLDSLVPAQVLARGQDLDTDSSDYYAVSITRGATAQLVKVIDGRTTVLGSVTTDAWLGSQWIQATLSLSGTTLRVQIYRMDTGQYLTADGQWQVAPTWALEKTDSSIRGAGRVGIGRASGYAGAVTFDNFVVTSAAPAPAAPGGGSPNSPSARVYNFDTTAAGSVPAGWTSWSNTSTGRFQVTPAPTISAPNALASSATSDVDARSWFTGQAFTDTQISASILVDGLTPSYLLARGQNLNGPHSSYYAVSVTRGLQVQLLLVNNGQRTVLASLTSATYLSNVWLSVGLRAVANTLEVVVFRQDTNQYLSSNRTWTADPVLAISATNGVLRSGYSGVGRYASYSGRVMFDDVALVDVANNTPPVPPADTPDPTTPPPASGGGTIDPGGVQRFPHIRIAQLAYYGTPIGDFEQNLLKTSIDLVVANPVYLDQMEAVAPGTTKLIYSNASNIYLSLLTDWLAYADRNGISREKAFYHASAPMPFSGSSSSSRPVNWFWSVQRGSDSTPWTDFTSNARKNAENFLMGALGQSVAIGYPERFREINVALKTVAGSGWASVYEYPTAVDASGRPTAWGVLRTTADGTNGFRASGAITFNPPADWKAASINGSDRLFYVRVRTTGTGAAPVVSSVLGRDYVMANGGNSGVIPVFDSAADKDKDGYLNDAEWAARRSGYNARFAYESRVFYPNYGQMRFATNVSDSAFQAWAADYSFRFLGAYPKADGLFMDNSIGRLQVDASKVQESLATYSDDYGALLGAINKKIGPRWVLANTAGAGKSADAIVRNGVAYLEEFALRPLASNTVQFEDMAAMVKNRLALSGGMGYAILDTYPTGGAPTDSRTQIASLAYYYLLADSKQTYLMFNGGYEPATSWTRHWTDAAAYNVGQPTNTWSVFATGADPSSAALTYKVYQRSYQNALVLYKPLSYTMGKGTGTTSDSTATTHVLNGSYRTLNANGMLGPVVNKITLRNGEGAILIKA